MQSELTVTHVERTQEVGSGCLLVEIDELKILVNFGTDQDMDISIYKSLEQLHGITHILLCSGDISSTGGLVHLEKLGIQAPILGTVPIKLLGRIEVLERIQILKEFHETDTYGDEAEKAFDRIIPLKYLQVYELSEHISIGPLNSGSSLGGAVWKIQRGDQEWVVCDKVNHRKEAHLDGMDIFNIMSPAGMVINSSAVKRARHTRKTRDTMLVSTVAATVRQGGKVLIPTSFSQLLEIVMVLHGHADTSSMPMVLYSFHGKKYIDTVKTILEWMGSSVLQRFNQEKENPFNLLKISFFNECPVGKIEGSVVFVIDKYGSSGFSPVILPIMASNPANTIVQVLDHQVYTDAVELSPVEYTKLSDTEIQKKHRQSKEEQERKETALKIENLIKEKIEDSSEEEEDRENIITKFWYEVQNETQTHENRMTYLDYDFGGVKKDVTFPAPARRKPSDDYGELIFIAKDKEEEEVQEVEIHAEVIKKQMYKVTVKDKQTIRIQAQVEKIIFAGECDMFNLRTMLTGLSSEKLMVYGENPDHRKILYNYLQYTRTAPEVLDLADRKEITAVRHTHPVKIQAELLSSISMQKFGTGMIGYFHGKIVPGEKTHLLSLSTETQPSPESVCLSSIKLKDLRQRFVEAKIKSEIVGDKLVVNENIFIYLEDPYLKIEGNISLEFYQVKRVLSKSVAFLTIG
ncbi:cleavage and polyadenylation specificity factor subunit 2 [Nematocida sp. AWRm77]|nr:cleavage and polyadenylation specificity factor subunit 2 [Nematocida sp. AWRm77]